MVVVGELMKAFSQRYLIEKSLNDKDERLRFVDQSGV
jgi:hypothetical protein